jgi:hypothetical protein
MTSMSPERWVQLEGAFSGGGYGEEFAAAWYNGMAFLAAREGLRGRHPISIEWKGGHRLPGDEAAPVDLRIDHVYLVSCKYRSQILHNSSPRQLFDNLLAPGAPAKSGDWYAQVAPAPFQTLYATVRDAIGDTGLPASAGDLSVETRRTLAEELRRGWPTEAGRAVKEFNAEVAIESAARWRRALGTKAAEEAMLWRLLRIGSAPYFILGSGPDGPMRLRIATPWDWRQQFKLRRFTVGPQPGGQPRVGWRAEVDDLRTGARSVVEGHVEVRWSHGRFAQPPEAKVYLDTPHAEVAGYIALS